MTGMFRKAGLGFALAATALASAAPAEAQRWGGRHYDRRGGGDAVAGAVIGGILGLGVGAAIASSNRPRYVDRGYYDQGYYPAPPPRAFYRPRAYVYNDYRPRCFDQWRYDPYYGDQVRVRVCN
ncbi:hypothetical protein ASE75_09180 [Sphingomonas sp. Leaf17]|uniref:hypothetical protein n=1 Tax=Sphingomonas sp. Leaf17 TaxID=1735683 RepID=UPI0006FF4A50|nr:hypothetical protein [Sphingomonas sp. Leaf17]KQM64167.1 hypothetical protein ASE75_09180 [Sphingomonas sp. Leaf17]